MELSIRNAFYADFIVAMPSKGNIPVKIGNQALAHHGIYLKWVYSKLKENPGEFVYNVF